MNIQNDENMQIKPKKVEEIIKEEFKFMKIICLKKIKKNLY